MSLITSQVHPLFTPSVIGTLKTNNIPTIERFLQTENKQLVSITKLTFKNILIIKKHILNKNAAVVRSADEYYKIILKSTAIIPTGYQEVDKLLGGGFYTGNIYEICGYPCSGKTQFCYNVLHKCIKDFQQNALYIDTKFDFSISRFNELLGDIDRKDILNKLHVQEITSIYELINSFYDIKQNFRKMKYRVIIIDSLPTILYQNKNISKYNMLINCLANIMRLIVIELHIVVIVVNNITSWQGSFNLPIMEKVGCGKYWNSIPNHRLKCTKENNFYQITVLKSNQIKENSNCNFLIK